MLVGCREIEDIRVFAMATNSQYLNLDNTRDLEIVYNVFFDDEVDQEHRKERVEEESDTDVEDVPHESREGNSDTEGSGTEDEPLIRESLYYLGKDNYTK